MKAIIVLLMLATLAAGCRDASTNAGRVLNIDSTALSQGIAGDVTRSPTVPVARPGEIDWAPLPGARIEIDRAGTTLGSVVSDPNGHFYVQLAPGIYRLTPRPMGTGSFPVPPQPSDVTVLPDTVVRVRIDYDTGIR